MSDETRASTDPYELVSSLYGPGTTACWYLTTLACVVTWTSHPKKKTSGSVDGNLIALLTYPVVAAGHLISQVNRLPRHSDEDSPTLTQQVAAIEAPLNITENFLGIAVLLFIIAVSSHCVKRAVLVAVVGLFCFAAEIVLFFAPTDERKIKENLSRPFLVSLSQVMIATIVFIAVLTLIVLGLLVMFYVRRRRTLAPRYPRETASDIFILREYQLQNPDDPFLDPHMKYITMISVFILPFSIFASMAASFTHIGSISPGPVLTWLSAVATQLTQDLYPRTSISIRDLDQTVAMLAGFTVLGFSLYGIANEWYRQWLEKELARGERPSLEMERLRPIVEERLAERRRNWCQE